MWGVAVTICAFLTISLMSVGTSSAVETSSQENLRREKHFSLFSVVTFKNEECTSLSTLTGGARYGTCYTTTECTDKGGTTSGNCASGFGVCCLFIDTSVTTKTISENRTYLRNSAYPSYETATTAVSVVYTIEKMASDICQIRLDFVDFIIGGPSVTTELITAAATTTCINDNLVIATTSGKTSKGGGRGVICGAMKGQHLYLELSPTSTDKATLTLSTVATATMTPAVAQRVWDIKTSQIPCYANYRAPAGCDRYLTDIQGKITGWNFYKVASSTAAAGAQNTGIELMNQNVVTCIRRSKGMCCVQYNVCTADSQGIVLTDSAGTAAAAANGAKNAGWSLDTDNTPFTIETTQENMGLVDSLCYGDYVEIPSSRSGPCGGSSGSTALINTRYCGNRFGIQLQASLVTYSSSGACDCSEPFLVHHYTDTASDIDGANGMGAANVDTTTSPRGFCIDYRQSPCWER